MIGMESMEDKGLEGRQGVKGLEERQGVKGLEGREEV